MRIGTVPLLTSEGGVYQYNLTILRVLHNWKSAEREFVVFTDDVSLLPDDLSNDELGWTIRPLMPPPQTRSLRQRRLDHLREIVGEGPHRQVWRRLRQKLQRDPVHTQVDEAVIDPDCVRWQPSMTQWFNECGIDFMFHPNHLTLSFEARTPFVMTVHDLQHRLQPEFPEVSANGVWEEREYLFRNAARYADLLLADSEVGKEDILNCYGRFGITADRIRVLPYVPGVQPGIVPEELSKTVREIYQLPEDYLFYPAQFWPHKNHARIVRALDLIKKEHSLRLPIVFCGSKTGEIREQTFQEFSKLADSLGLNQQIHYLGYLPDEHMAALYAGARALVMPTFFGPTNIPILEAWVFGCPVVTSDIRGVREQVGDAAMLVDPRSVESIADGIYRVWTDDRLRSMLVERGKRQAAAYTPDDFSQRLIDILQEGSLRIFSNRRQVGNTWNRFWRKHEPC